MDHFAVVRKTNLEYARLLRDILRRHESFTREYVQVREATALAEGGSPIAVPTRWGFVSSYQNACLSAVADVQTFWANFGSDYGVAAREAEGLKPALATRRRSHW